MNLVPVWGVMYQGGEPPLHGGWMSSILIRSTLILSHWVLSWWYLKNANDSKQLNLTTFKKETAIRFVATRNTLNILEKFLNFVKKSFCGHNGKALV